MSSIEKILPGGKTAIILGVGDGLIALLKQRYSRVIVADPTRKIGSSRTTRLLRESSIEEVHGEAATPENLPGQVDCLVATFSLASSDDPVRFADPWIRRLCNGGRFIAIEWAAYPAIRTDSPQTDHAELLQLLESNSRIHRPTGQQLIRILQSCGLTHTRQQTENAGIWFTSQDISYMIAEAMTHIADLGLSGDPLVHKLREKPLTPAPLTIAYGTRKIVLPLKEAREKSDVLTNNVENDSRAADPEKGLKELLASVLGNLVDDPLETASKLLTTFGARALGAMADPKPIADTVGISLPAARKMIAILELGRRLNLTYDSGVREIHGPEDAYRHLAPQMAKLTREHFRGLYLDVKGKIIADEVISIGTLTTALVHPREVYGPAIEQHCHSLLIAHNHPSGDPNPSPEDIHITRELAEAGHLLGIELLDHIVIGRDTYVSMKEQNYY